GKLPAEKLLSEIVPVLECQPHDRVARGHEGVEPWLGRIVLLTRQRERYEDTVAPVHLGRAQRLFGDGQDPLPLLAGALRDELRAPAARLLPEVAVQAVGLLRRPGLARNEEQRAPDVLASERGDYRTRVGAVEHRERRVARLAAERVPQHLGRQARAPHAAQ